MKKNNRIIFGAAYYDEYMPYDRLDKDVAMLKAAHMNTVRIAESTWSTMEPRPGEFDFSHIDRVLNAMGDAGINVIIGTPTYAVPAWLVALDPEVLARTHHGNGQYGPRQIMDITNATYLFYAERAIRALISHVADSQAVIGYQVDNETKHYDCVSRTMQQRFVEYLRRFFNDDCDAMNREFGLDYWSNRINSWTDFPDLANTINGSLSGVFDRFRRQVAADFLGWQAKIVREYARSDQFITQNFDLEWRGYSFGVQQWTDMFRAASYLDIAGIDIYHPSQSQLTGREIGFGSDLARSLKSGRNYLLLETQAQGQNKWLPYPGQLRLQGYSHLANGSNSVMYWHWHSIHNSYETYWKGLLSQDFEPNATYLEASRFGSEIEALSDNLVNLSKQNKVALMVNHESLTALARFTIETGFPDSNVHNHHQESRGYNDVIRWIYDALFDLNIECDFITSASDFEILCKYEVIITPALYVCDEDCIMRLRSYVRQGGNLISTFKSFFTNESVKVWTDRQPHHLTDVFGISYSQFTVPDGTQLSFCEESQKEQNVPAELFMELLRVDKNVDVIAKYNHQSWGQYAAVTANRFGEGKAWWIGTMFASSALKMLLSRLLKELGLWSWKQEIADKITVRCGINDKGQSITYFLNYSENMVTVPSPIDGNDLFDSLKQEKAVDIIRGDLLNVEPWGVRIISSAR